MPAALSMDLATAAAAVAILPFIKRKNAAASAGYGEVDNGPDPVFSGMENVYFRRKIYTVNLLFAILITPVTYLSNLYIVNYYGTEVWRLTLNELSYGTGGLLASFVLSKSKINNSRKAITVSLFLGGAVTMCLSLLKNYYVVYEIFIMLTAGATAITQILLVTMVQKQCHSKYHGRIFAGLKNKYEYGFAFRYGVFWHFIGKDWYAFCFSNQTIFDFSCCL